MRVYTFITEDGTEKLTHEEYMKRPELREKVGLISVPPVGRVNVHYGTTIFSYDRDWLNERPPMKRDMEYLHKQVSENALAYYIPHEGTALAFLNDDIHTGPHAIKGLNCGNGWGKSALAWIDMALDIGPCDPDWPIFKDGGVKWREYRGPFIDGGFGVVTYEWRHHQATIWPQIIRKWTPWKWLGKWKPGGQEINWNLPIFQIAGTPVWLMACSQSNEAFTSQALDRMWWDEQPQRAKFEEANARVRRRNGRHTISCTPHKIQGRPDTGGGTFIEDLATGRLTFGMKVKFYEGSINEVQDWVMTKEMKKAIIREWIAEPLDNGDKVKYKEGLARVHGKFHQSAGLVYDEIDEKIHFIDPFPLQKSWTFYRGVDHGRVNATGAVFAAVTENNDIVIYDEYLRNDQTASESAKNIIERSGNTIKEVGDGVDGGKRFKRYSEVPTKRAFRRTMLDPRSFGRKSDDSRYTVGQLYRFAGLAVMQASGSSSETTIPFIKELMHIDKKRKHIVTGQPGAARLYIFRTCRNLCRQLRSYRNEEVSRIDKRGNVVVSERPRKGDDHLVDAMRYMLLSGLTHVEGYGKKPTEEEIEDAQHRETRRRDPVTGY